MENSNEQRPFTVNQEQNEKPNVPTAYVTLTGNLATSFDGGHNRTLTFKKVMAGERHKEYNLFLKISTLTPQTPPFQNLRCTIRSYFVPNSRVWTNAEKYTAQKGGTTEIKIDQIPNIGGQDMPRLKRKSPNGTTYAVDLCHTTAWRDSFISAYIPRIGYNVALANDETENPKMKMPAASVLPLRGRVAIYNDFERNKNYDTAHPEYKGDIVSAVEWNSYLPEYETARDYYSMRSMRQNSYYTDYRTEYQGQESEIPTNTEQGGAIENTNSWVQWANWESKIAEVRSQAENSMLNDWQIIAKIRGSKLLTEGKVQLIGEHTFNLNYNAITQSAYNTNSEVREEFQVMGKQGAYSYTEIKVPCYAAFEANEEGYIHIIATVQAETVFESAFDRNELNITPFDEYRPDLKDDKLDVIYMAENGTTLNQNYTESIGFKRKYSEYFKLPNTINGDMTSLYYHQTTAILQGAEITIDFDDTQDHYPINVITQKTYQYFETDRRGEALSVGTFNINQEKKIWLDYTDLMINKNLAIPQDVVRYTTTGATTFQIIGNNQIFVVGKSMLVAELPIDKAIVNNYTDWGEH